jgi:hypothetical protein
MKTLLSLWIGIQITLIPLSFAQGDTKGNGGEENEILYSFVATEIKNWLLSGGHHALQMKPDVSHDQFSKAMVKTIDDVLIRFTEEPIEIGLAPKTCHNFEESGRSVLRCNIERFRQLTVPERFNLLFHEFAGAAGFERDQNGKSNYYYTDQAMKYLEMKVVYSLRVSVPKLAGYDEFRFKRHGRFRLVGFNPLNQEHLRRYDAARHHCIEQAAELKVGLASLVQRGAEAKLNETILIPELEYTDGFWCSVRVLAPQGLLIEKNQSLVTVTGSRSVREAQQYVWKQRLNPNFIDIESNIERVSNSVKKLSNRYPQMLRTVELSKPIRYVEPTLERAVHPSAIQFCEQNSRFGGLILNSEQIIFGNPDRPDCSITLQNDGSTEINATITDGTKALLMIPLPARNQYWFSEMKVSFHYIGLRGSGARYEHIWIPAIQVKIVLDRHQNIQTIDAEGLAGSITEYPDHWLVKRSLRGQRVHKKYKSVRIRVNNETYLNRYIRP